MPVICQYCGTAAVVGMGETVYPDNPYLQDRVFWVCPKCGAYVGSHSDGEPLGELANEELRRARLDAHVAFDRIWREGAISRTDAYEIMALALGIPKEKCHIAMFDLDTCARVVEWAERWRW